MQVKFKTDYLYLLFADSFFQDNQIGAKVTATYRIVVNYILSANSISDLHQAQFLDLSPCDDLGFYSVTVNPKYKLIISIETEQIVLHRLDSQDTK
nr:MAG TPA: XRE family transcriptional regulator [Caudoviricetes sp.]